MDELIRSDSVLALGRKIVDELDHNRPSDTLARWMSHYIAEKIEEAEAATGEARERKMSECCDAILMLWDYRSRLPNGKRPFEDFEPIFRVLRSLDMDDATPRYFNQIRPAIDKKDEDTLNTQWLNKATEIDYAARILIRYCLTIAAQDSVEKSRDWVTLAEAIRKEGDIMIIRYITNDTDVLNSEDVDDSAKIIMEDFLEKLEGFNQLSAELSLRFRQQLDQVSS